MSLQTISGIAATASEVLTALSTFLTGTAGWTLHDTLSATDKVFLTRGTSGTEQMYFRLSIDKQIVSDSLGDPSNLFRNLSVRGYLAWDNVSHTGSKEYGFFGPEILWRQNTNVPQGDSVESVSGKLPYHLWDDYFRNETVGSFDGRRKFFYFYSNNMMVSDFVSRELSLRSITNLPSYVIGGCHVPVGDQERIYIFCTSALAWTDAVSGTWYMLQAPPATLYNGVAFPVWDGGDYIYIGQGYYSSAFYRYRISTNTWETLPNFPAQADRQQPYLVYIPASCSAFGFNAILYNGSSNNYSYVFNTDTLAWDDSKKISGLAGLDNGVSVFDGKRYLYYRRYSAWWDHAKYDLKANPITFTWVGRNREVTTSYFDKRFYLHMLLGQARLSDTSTIGYRFFADADALTVVTTVAGKTFWMHCGKYDSYYAPPMVLAEAVATSGINQTLTVDDTSAHVAGDELLVWNRGAGTVGKVIIQQVVDATTLLALTPFPLEAGAKLGRDPCPYVITGDTELASTPLDNNGYETNLRAANYFQTPLVSAAAEARGAGARGAHLLWPRALSCNWEELDSYGQPGQLKHVFSAKKYTDLVDGDYMRFGAGRYQVFFPAEVSLNGSEFNRAIAVGPF